MAAITACTPVSSITRTALMRRSMVAVPSSSLGLSMPAVVKRAKVRCSMDTKPKMGSSNVGMGGSLIAAAWAATVSCPAVALVDERMSTEGTGLPFGLSNNLLGWILFGVFGLIWSLYIVYASTLDEDEESGLSL